MQPHRLVASSLLASSLLAAGCILPAAAQSRNPLLSSDAAPPANPLVTSQPLSLGPSTPSTLNLTTPSPGSLQFKASPKDFNSLVLHPTTQTPGINPKPQELALLKPDATLLPQTNQPCAKLRSYNFTSKDLKAAHPHASSETDCTPASSGHLKTIPATVDTK
jgi:hypothetical protein